MIKIESKVLLIIIFKFKGVKARKQKPKVTIEIYIPVLVAPADAIKVSKQRKPNFTSGFIKNRRAINNNKGSKKEIRIALPW